MPAAKSGARRTSIIMITRCLSVLLLLLLAGCRDKPSEVVVAPKKKVDDDKTPVALDIFRQAADPPQFREALNLLSANLARPDVAARLTLTGGERAFLESDAKLSPPEL